MSFWHCRVIPFCEQNDKESLKYLLDMEEKSMYVMIDNFDSFVYNLKAYFQELGREILVRRCDEITLEEWKS